ncbi:polyphosphate kinase 1 [Halosimplex sp. J119]
MTGCSHEDGDGSSGTDESDGGTVTADGDGSVASAGDDGGTATDDGDASGTEHAGTVSILDAGPPSVSVLGADGGTDTATGEADGVDVHSAEFDASASEYYLNRELSELAYQRRVLHEALDERNPLLERVRFLSIFTRNMDEFFMKRVGGLKQQIEAGITDRTVDGRTPREQWEEVLDAARPMFARQTDCYENVIRPALAEAGIHVVDYDDLSADERASMREYFERSVLPTLTPLAFDPAHPFPFISNLSLSLAVLTREDDEESPTFTRVKVPQNLPRLVEVAGGERYVLIEEVVRANLDLLFPNAEVVEASLFRLTRNAEVRRDEEVAEDLIDMIEEVLEQRRFATAVRLEVEAGTSERVRQTLVEQLDVSEQEVFERPGPMDYREFDTLLELDRPGLKLPSWTPKPHPRLQRQRTPLNGASDDGDIFARIREDDILLHHPYHSFTDTVQRFLDEAANDPDVLAIKAAIYRTASDSQVIQSLIDAADNGKQVAVMVELKARFDEQNNLEWVRRLEENGIHVAYGTIGLKTHTKTALVVREEDDGVELYSHVATGNYHSETAKGYVDLGLLTADRDIGQDLVKVFNFFTGPSLDEEFRKLLIAPVTMRDRLTRYIRREAEHAREGRSARIVAKVNALEDPDLVAELYEAAMAGVDVDLIVRDICRLRPGIEGVSENVNVYSVVGRFLEHSRIYYFENGARDPDLRAEDDAEGGEPEYYIGSADWMTRNLDSRVEAVAPVEDTAIREQLRFVLDLLLRDNRKRWEMNADGSYEQHQPGPGEEVINTQEVLMERARRAATDDDVERGIPTDAATETDLLVEPVDPDLVDLPADDRDADDGSSAGETAVGEVEPFEETDEVESVVATAADGSQVAENGDSTVAASSDGSPDTETDDGRSPAENGGSPTTEGDAGASGAEASDLPALLRTNPDRWYRPDSDHYAFAIRTPDGTVYRKTTDGAATVVERIVE